jgi:hypothetical protein
MSQPSIRPTLESLRRFPTLQQVQEASSRLELKLETEDTRYWVTTEGVPEKTAGVPINYVVDYVTVEKLSDNGKWNLRAVYSPEAWRLSQGFDYCQLLHRDLEQLQKRLETDFDWDTVQAIERVEGELESVNRVLSNLAEIVRSR